MVKQTLKQGCDAVGAQLKAVLDNVVHPNDNAIPTMMSPRQTMAHLYEVYEAVLVMAAGGKHDWGSYEIPPHVAEQIEHRLWDHRDKAIEAIMAMPDDQAAHTAVDYILLHDAYHVGQLCAHRLATESGWSPYSIYPS